MIQHKICNSHVAIYMSSARLQSLHCARPSVSVTFLLQDDKMIKAKEARALKGKRINHCSAHGSFPSGLQFRAVFLFPCTALVACSALVPIGAAHLIAQLAGRRFGLALQAGSMFPEESPPPRRGVHSSSLACARQCAEPPCAFAVTSTGCWRAG